MAHRLSAFASDASSMAVRRRPARRLVAALVAALAALILLLTPSVGSALPGTSAFVQRDGTHLTLNGKPFRFAGPNLYWLGLDENVGGGRSGRQGNRRLSDVLPDPRRPHHRQ